MLIIIFTSNCTFLVSIEPQALAESDPVQSKYEPWLWKKLSELEANGTTRFMTIGVGVNCTPFKHNETAAYCFKTQVANLLFQEHNATILYVGKVLSFINIKIKNSEIKKIAAYEFIDGLADGERKGKLCLDVSTTVVRSKFVNERLGYNGAGINISVLDSGIDPNHPDLANKNIVWRDFVNGQLSPYDDYGHGTHCAGVIAGTGINSPDLKYRGAASGVNRLIIGKLGDQWGNIPNETIARTALDWAISEGAQVISCSWGFWSYEEGVCNGKCELCRKADECVQKGAVVVCAAGNRGPSSQTIECPGTAFDVITVGNVDDHNMELRHVTLRDGSSRGPTYDGRIKPDVVAPGTCIISCRAHNTDIRTPADSYIDSL